MRDMVTCFSEHAIRISETTCSSYINHDLHSNLTPSIPNTLTYLYKTTLNSNPNTLLITITWSKNPLGHGDLTIHFGENGNPSNSFKLNTFSRLFRKKKGQKLLDFDSSKINIYWDFSLANYNSGPEPVNGYYVLLVADPDVILLSLGDLAEEAVTKRLKNDYNNQYKLLSKSVLISQREYYTGNNTLYSTKVQFCDSGISHEVVIRCSEDHDKMKQPVLYVSIDKRTVIKIRRLQWNFRGNQTVFVDGLLVDLMWDVHDWFYNPFSGPAVFLFKTRSGGESRLWLEDKFGQKDQQKVEFSLIIYASKSN